MESYTYISYTLSLVESSGMFGRAGSPNLFCWAKGVHLPAARIDDGHVLVLSRDSAAGAWREYGKPVSLEQSRKIIELLNALGIPGQSPGVEGVVDTSDGWSHISFQTRLDEQHSNLDIPMHSSGFSGDDAAKLRELFCYLFDLAGYEAYNPSIYGNE